MITPIASRIGEILDAQTQYAIPRYQRDFKWGESEARELVEDLDNYRSVKGEQLFLGNFILEASDGQKTYVIDGQQRLTCLMLLLIACRMRAQALGNVQLAGVIQARLTFVDAATAQSVGTRFVASDSIRDVFDHMADFDWDGKLIPQIGKKQVRRQVRRIRPLWEFFRGHVASMTSDELSEFLRALYDAYVIRFEIKDDEEALHIFERTNARGMDLEIADLLKNYLFSERVEAIEDRWQEVLDNADGTMLRMLKYYYIANFGYVKKSQLYRSLKSYGKAQGPEQLTTELAAFSRFYSLAKEPTEERTRAYFTSIELTGVSEKEYRYKAIAASLQALQEFGITQFIPVAYAAIGIAQRSTVSSADAQAKSLIRLFELLEKYHFINNVICERVGNEVERLYADTCKEWASSDALQKCVDGLKNRLQERRAKFDEFRPRFADVSYSPSTIAIICYIFDRLNNHGLDTGQRLQIYVPSAKHLKRSNNIEHFLPQKPKADFVVDDETKESVDCIGNLLPLYFKTNSRLGNISPAEKVAKLNGEMRKEIQNLPFVLQFLEQYGDKASEWNANAIQERGEDLAKEAFDTVWALT
jgi:hypothetical protein